jgi:multicomponent Na+:H+ antiporter subunit B
MGETMRSSSIMAVIVTVLLAAVLIYVAEDIPGFGDPEAPAIKSVKLFSLPVDGVELLLSQGSIPETLVVRLHERGLPGPSRVEKISGAEGQWNLFVPKEEMRYPKEEKYYLVRKEGRDLVVSRYAFVVRWIEKGEEETGVPNMVTYGLADYRGYDTLGETSVIFTAGVSVILLLRRRGRL